jgi:hypothetical protein
MCDHHVHYLGYRLAILGYPDLAHYLVDILGDMIAGNLQRGAELLHLELCISTGDAFDIITEMYRLAAELVSESEKTVQGQVCQHQEPGVQTPRQEDREDPRFLERSGAVAIR